ncbi:hypothetical protein GCM10008164_56170 [Achromobacter xylosoxidans]|nr:hypothetical protein GCM10008164_56170 [Achromobacter xylosoxidans]
MRLFLFCRLAIPLGRIPGREGLAGCARRWEAQSRRGSGALQKLIVAARAGPVSSAKLLNAMDFYEFGTGGCHMGASVGEQPPTRLLALKYRFTAGCQSSGGGGR